MKKAVVYKAPQECFDASVVAEGKGDFETVVGCLAPVAQKDLAAGFGVLFAGVRTTFRETREGSRGGRQGLQAGLRRVGPSRPDREGGEGHQGEQGCEGKREGPESRPCADESTRPPSSSMS